MIMDLMNEEKITSLAREIGQENVPVLLDIFLGELSSYQETLLAADDQARIEHLKEISHALKSSAASFGADRLCALAIDIDMRGKQSQIKDIEKETQALVDMLRETHQSYQSLVVPS